MSGQLSEEVPAASLRFELGAGPMLQATFSVLPTTLMIEGLVPFRVGPIRPCIAATLGLGPPPSRQDLEAVRGDGRPGEAESSWLANSLGPTGQS